MTKTMVAATEKIFSLANTIVSSTETAVSVTQKILSDAETMVSIMKKIFSAMKKMFSVPSSEVPSARSLQNSLWKFSSLSTPCDALTGATLFALCNFFKYFLRIF